MSDAVTTTLSYDDVRAFLALRPMPSSHRSPGFSALFDKLLVEMFRLNYSGLLCAARERIAVGCEGRAPRVVCD